MTLYYQLYAKLYSFVSLMSLRQKYTWKIMRTMHQRPQRRIFHTVNACSLHTHIHDGEIVRYVQPEPISVL